MRFNHPSAYTVETAKRSTKWWRSLTVDQQKRYLERHPRSRFVDQPGDKPVSVSPKSRVPSAGEQPPKLKAKALQGLGATALQAETDEVQKNFTGAKEVEHADKALRNPERWKPSRVRKAAQAIRDGLMSNTAKGLMKAAARVLVIAGAALIIPAASVGLGIPVDLLLPAILHRAWDNVKNTRDDLKLVKNFTTAMRAKLKERPSDKEVQDSLVDSREPANA